MSVMKDQRATSEMNHITILGSIFAHAEKLRVTRSHKLQIFSAVFLCLLFAQTASAEYLLTTISSVGSNPNGVAYDSAKGEIFVVSQSSNTVSVISDATNTVVGSPISVGTAPISAAYDSAKGEIFVTNNGGDSVSVIDDTTNTVVATISVGSSPLGVAYDSGKGEIFVANFGSNSVSVISDSAPLSVPEFPLGGMVLMFVVSTAAYAVIRYRAMRISHL